MAQLVYEIGTFFNFDTFELILKFETKVVISLPIFFFYFSDFWDVMILPAFFRGRKGLEWFMRYWQPRRLAKKRKVKLVLNEWSTKELIPQLFHFMM